MANSTTNVSVGKPKVTGSVYIAPIGTTLPTDADTALASAFKDLGYVSEDGVTNSNTAETTKLKAWGGDTVYTSQTDKPDTFQFTLIEVLREDAQKAVYGDDNVTTSSGLTTIKANSKEAEPHIWVIETVLQGHYKRIVIPNGKLSEVGDITYKDDELIGYQITVDALPDSQSNTHYEYIEAITAGTSS